jgi:hypothetical protein
MTEYGTPGSGSSAQPDHVPITSNHPEMSRVSVGGTGVGVGDGGTGDTVAVGAGSVAVVVAVPAGRLSVGASVATGDVAVTV